MAPTLRARSVVGMETLRDTDLVPLVERAVALAAANVDDGQLPFGALVVRDGQVVATGVNTALRDDDLSAHAEVIAVREASRALGTLDLSEAVVVASCEPCPQCRATAALAGIATIVFPVDREAPRRAGFELPPPAARMQDLLRSEVPEGLRLVPVAGAEVPFDRWLARSAT
jgi:tRNA(Arg) A34 adenosine deaminase TadA